MSESGTIGAILSAIGGKTDLLDIATDFLTGRTSDPKDSTFADKTTDVDQIWLEGRTIFGYMSHGDFNQTSKLYDRKARKAVHERTPDQAELVSHYYRITIPENERKALLIVQRWSNQSPLTLFEDQFVEFCKSKFKGTGGNLRVVAAHPADVYRALLDGAVINSISVVTRHKPKDQADALKQRLLSTDYDLRVQLVPRGGAIANKLKSLSENPKTIMDSLEFKELEGGDVRSIKANVQIDGTKTTLDLTDLEKGRPYHNVTTEIVVDPKSQLPTLDSIHAAAQNLEKKLFKGFGIDV